MGDHDQLTVADEINRRTVFFAYEHFICCQPRTRLVAILRQFCPRNDDYRCTEEKDGPRHKRGRMDGGTSFRETCSIAGSFLACVLR